MWTSLNTGLITSQRHFSAHVCPCVHSQKMSIHRRNASCHPQVTTPHCPFLSQRGYLWTFIDNLSIVHGAYTKPLSVHACAQVSGTIVSDDELEAQTDNNVPFFRMNTPPNMCPYICGGKEPFMCTFIYMSVDKSGYTSNGTSKT